MIGGILDTDKRIDEIERYLSFLYGGVDVSNCIVLCRIKTDDEMASTGSRAKIETRIFYNNKIRQAATSIAGFTNKGQVNFYCQVGVTKKECIKSSSSRSKEFEITQLPAFYVDIDYYDPEAHKKANLPPDKEAVLNLLYNAFMQPSMIVHSGRGVHAYWILDKPVDISIENLEEIKNINRSIHAIILDKAKQNRWTIDSVFDLSRILRVPGTINRKGKTDLFASIEEDNDITYSLETIKNEIEKRNPQPECVQTSFVQKRQAALKPYTHVSTIQPTRKNISAGYVECSFNNETIILNPMAVVSSDEIDDLISVNPTIIQIIDGKWDKAKFPSTSECDYEIVKTAIDCKWSFQKAADILIHYRNKNNLDTSKVLRPSYIINTFKNAAESCIKKNLSTDAKSFQRDMASDMYASVNSIPDETKEKHRVILSGIIGVEVLKLIKHTGDDPSYTLKTNLGDVFFAKIDDITSKTRFKNRLAAAVNKLIELPRDWVAFANMLLSIVEYDTNDESSRSSAIVRGYLSEYYIEALVRYLEFSRQNEIMYNNKLSKAAAIAANATASRAFGDRNPYFERDIYSKMFFFIDHFFSWIKDYRKSEFKMGEIRIILRSLDECSESFEANTVIKRSVWIYNQSNDDIIQKVITSYNREINEEAYSIINGIINDESSFKKENIF